MNKIWAKKCIAVLCAVGMIIPSISINNVKAEELDSAVADEIVMVEETVETDSEVDTSVAKVEESETGDTEETVEETDTTNEEEQMLLEEVVEEVLEEELAVETVTEEIIVEETGETSEEVIVLDEEVIEDEAETVELEEVISDEDGITLEEDSIDKFGDVSLEAVEENVELVEDGAALQVSVMDYVDPTTGDQDWRDVFQAALDTPRTTSTQKLIVNVPAGTYELRDTIFLRSNTTLELDAGAIMRRTAGNTKIMLGNAADDCGDNPFATSSLGGYKRTHDIKVIGGEWDHTKNGGGTDEASFSNCIYFAHAKNVEIRDLKAYNCSGVHLIEVSGCKNVVIDNVNLGNYVTTRGAISSDAEAVKEAIQLDYTTEASSSYYPPYDSTTCDNVTVSNCTIINYPSAVGQHTDMGSKYHTNITIKDNTFESINNTVMTLMNFKNVTVTGNVIKPVTTSQNSKPIVLIRATGIIQDNTISTSSCHGIDVSGKSVITLNSNKISGCKRCGIRVSEQSNVDSIDNTITNCSNTAISYSDNSYGVIQSNTLKNCKYGLIDLETGYATIKGNKLYNPDYASLTLKNVKTATVIQSNTFSKTKTYPITIKGCANIAIKSNTIKNFGDYGIYVRESDDGKTRSNNILICDNKVSLGGSNGISVRNTDGATITRNTVSDVNNLGIYVANTCKKSNVYSNTASKIEVYDTTTGTNGWVKHGDGTWSYYVSGKAAVGWKKVDGAWYYFTSKGIMKRNEWFKSGNYWYYFKNGGEMAVGWTKVDGKWYYLKSGGEMAMGWIKVDGKWYYLNSGGDMAVGWKTIGKNKYYLNSGGDMAVGWKTISKKKYYFRTGGEMATGWIKVGGYEYYLYSDGHMAKSTWIGKYYVDSTGKWTKTR